MRSGFGFDSPASGAGVGKSPKGLASSENASSVDSGEFSYSHAPPLGPNDVEFFVDSPLKRKARESVRSERKTVGCFTFDILVFPAGNQASFGGSPKVAVYVECVGVDGKDERWVYNSVKFSVTVVNFKDYRKSLYHEDSHSFCAAAVDRGWPELIPHADLTPDSGWLDDQGRLCVRASVCVRQADTLLMGADFDTRKETGFIGLKNHGATCYLNGLLQSYFHIGKFRELVYQMLDDAPHAHGGESPSGTRMTLPLALQSVFLKLESSEHPVNTLELTRAFGWDSMDAFTQHDVQELARILCDKLEEKLKGSSHERAIQDLFEGELENIIECLDIDHKSTKTESFYDIPLNVRGLAGEPLVSLQAALREFTAVEVMEGDNAYDAESRGKQRAKKGIRFKKFPPVLSFQLKRFSFDYEKLDNVKLNDRFEFPTSVDMDEFATAGGAGVYDLHTVLVHAGDVHSGHYYAFIRPQAAEPKQWFRFDDEQVSPCSEFAAVDDNFGGEDAFPFNFFLTKRGVVRPRIHNAYMLVYIKRSVLRVIQARPSVSEVQERVMKESKRIDERKRIHEAKLLALNATIFTANDLTSNRGGNEVNLRRDQKIVDVTSQICGEDGERSKKMALFYMHSSNPRIPPKWTLMSPLYVSASATPKSSRLWGGSAHGDRKFPGGAVTEIPANQGERRINDFPLSDDSTISLLAVAGETDPLQSWTDATPYVLIVVKIFDVAKLRMKTVAVKYCHVDDKVSVLVGEAAVALGLPEIEGSDSVLGFEESGSAMREIELGASFAGNNIASGSTIVFQVNTITEAETEESSEDDESLVPSVEVPVFHIRTVADYALSLSSSVQVDLVLHDASEPIRADGLLAGPEELLAVDPAPTCRVKMDIRWNLRVLVDQVINALNLPRTDLNKFRIEVFETDPFVSRHGPIATSDDLKKVGRIGKIGGCKRLGSPANADFAHSWKLHVVGVPRNAVCVRVFDSVVRESACCFVRDSPATVEELVGVLMRQVPGAISSGRMYRLVEVFKSQITQLHRRKDAIDCQRILATTENALFEYLRIEPDDDVAGPLCFVSHLDKHSGIHFGYPFVVAVELNATAKQVRHAIQEKLGLNEKQANKWRLCLDGQRPHHLKDDDLVASSPEAIVNIVLEHSHPNPELLGYHKAHATAYKPLTIR